MNVPGSDVLDPPAPTRRHGSESTMPPTVVAVNRVLNRGPKGATPSQSQSNHNQRYTSPSFDRTDSENHSAARPNRQPLGAWQHKPNIPGLQASRQQGPQVLADPNQSNFVHVPTAPPPNDLMEHVDARISAIERTVLAGHENLQRHLLAHQEAVQSLVLSNQQLMQMLTQVMSSIAPMIQGMMHAVHQTHQIHQSAVATNVQENSIPSVNHQSQDASATTNDGSARMMIVGALPDPTRMVSVSIPNNEMGSVNDTPTMHPPPSPNYMTADDPTPPPMMQQRVSYASITDMVIDQQVEYPRSH